MAAADTVESQLRNTVRAARTRSLRCVKAIIAKKSSNLDPDSVTYTLALANSAPDEGQSLDKEFQRCVKGLLEPEKPSFLLFRADLCENIDGSRWLLLAWLPDVVPEIDRARYVRSRGLLADLVPQPYFLSELLAREVKSLVWSSAAAALSRTRRPKEAEEDLPAKPPTLEAPQGPLRLSQAAQGLLQRLANKEDSCLKLVVIRTARQQAPQLEAKVMDCRSPSQLAKADLPSTSCFFALVTRDDLVFVHWCPDRLSRDPHTRMRDDSRYAVLKPTVLRLVLAAFPAPPRVLQVDAREPQELADNANKADERAEADAADSKVLVPQGTGGYPPADGCEPKWPARSKADWPFDWPKEVITAVAMPAALQLPMRPVPHWRGGSKNHSISSSAPSIGSAVRKIGAKRNTTRDVGR